MEGREDFLISPVQKGFALALAAEGVPVIGIFAREEEDERDAGISLMTFVLFFIQKAAKGDTSAAKFIKEISGEGDSPDDAGISICIPSAMWSSAIWQASHWRS